MDYRGIYMGVIQEFYREYIGVMQGPYWYYLL